MLYKQFHARLPVGVLGHELVQLLARIQGEQPESLRYFRPPEWFTQRLPLLAEATSWQALSFPLKRLLQELEHFLESRQQQTRQLLLSFYHRDGSVSKLQVGLAHGGYQAEALLRLCQLKMESTQFLAPVLDIGLQAKQLQGPTFFTGGATLQIFNPHMTNKKKNNKPP